MAVVLTHACCFREKMSSILVLWAVISRVLFRQRNRVVSMGSEFAMGRGGLVFNGVHEKRVAGVERSEIVKVTSFFCEQR